MRCPGRSGWAWPSVGRVSGTSFGYRADIDGLRAVSILLVVAFHAGLVGFEGGYVGVDVFFVLSGYLITSLLVLEQQRTGRVSLADFVARRVRRLLPLAALVIATTVMFGFWLLPPVQRRILALDAVASSLYVANWRSAAQTTAYVDVRVADDLLLHYWSLSVEEQFYVVWPLLVVVVCWAARRWSVSIRGALTASISVVVVVSFVMSATLTDSLGPAAYYVTHLRVWEMGAGALLALLLPRVVSVPRRIANPLGILGAVVIVGSALVFGSETVFPGTAALAPVLGAIAVIVAGSSRGSWMSWLLARRPLPGLGRLSYAWYLWHWPMIGLSLLYVDRVGWAVSPGSTTAFAVVASLGVAWVSHILIEQRVRHATSLLGRRPSLALGLSLTLMPVALVVGLLQVRDTGDRAVAIPQIATATQLPTAAEATGGPVEQPDDELIASGGVSVAANPSSGIEGVPPVDPMTPAEAADDRVTLGARGCHSGGGDRVNVGAECVFGAPEGEVTIVLLGDSHAQHWLPALDVAGRQAGWRVLAWTKGSCPFLDVTVWDSRGGAVHSGCDRWYEVVTERLRAEAPIDLVLLGRSYRYEDLVVGRDGERVDRELAEEMWRVGAASTFSSLTQIAKVTVPLVDTPWAADDVPSCLSEQPERPERCAIDLAEGAGLDARLNRAERRAATDQVVFLDLTDLVCPGDPCQVVTPTGTIIYHDAHHLTQTYSTQLGPGLIDRLAPLVERAAER